MKVFIDRDFNNVNLVSPPERPETLVFKDAVSTVQSAFESLICRNSLVDMLDLKQDSDSFERGVERNLEGLCTEASENSDCKISLRIHETEPLS